MPLAGLLRATSGGSCLTCTAYLQGGRSKASTPRSDSLQLTQDDGASEASSKRVQRSQQAAPKGWSPRDVQLEPVAAPSQQQQQQRRLSKLPSRQLPGALTWGPAAAGRCGLGAVCLVLWPQLACGRAMWHPLLSLAACAAARGGASHASE